MKKISIIGAGIGGCAAALSFAQKGFDVSVIERMNTIFTEGAGILLYSNALKSLDNLSVLPEILSVGYSMDGHTQFLDDRSNLIGTVTYESIDSKYPAYVGIDRQKFLEILYNRAKNLGVKFHFDQKIIFLHEKENRVSIVLENDKTIENNDLVIAADGTNSFVRQKLWDNSQAVFSGFGLWHSMHDLHPMVKEKITVVLKDRRFGIIPVSESQMYIWASIKEPAKRYIPKSDQAKEMYREFNSVEGFLKDIINELPNISYAHYTSVEEVTVGDSWHKGRIVLLGDSAHASLPFMAQGAAMALQDSVVLADLVSKECDLEVSLKNYYSIRKPVVDTVQSMCRQIGISYNYSFVDLNKIQQSLNSFYKNKSFFN
jgi:2-polyprenyl-6-methoxyphenol hydroxylase-like FAD-dependent oxidoreductase